MNKKIVSELKYLSSYYSVDLLIRDLPHGMSGVNVTSREVQLSKEIKTRSYALSIFFHELGHVYCRRNGKWINYHLNPKKSKQALRAERWIDKWAKKELTKYDSSVIFHDSYGGRQGAEFLKQYAKT